MRRQILNMVVSLTSEKIRVADDIAVDIGFRILHGAPHTRLSYQFYHNAQNTNLENGSDDFRVSTSVVTKKCSSYAAQTGMVARSSFTSK